ncbi:MAG: hypothetical protein AAGA77_25705, partial [Bacteroidota bacterium]
KYFPRYADLFKIKDVGFALFSKKFNEIKDYKSIPKNSAIVLRNFEIDSQKSIEQWLKYTYQYLESIGLLFAFGKPGELFQSRGVGKIYINSYDNWYEILRNAISRVKLVFAIHDCSDGLVWEIKQCVMLNNPSKLIIFIPPYKRASEYQEINRSLNEKICHILPKKLPTIENLEKAKIGFVAFKKDWTPYLITPTGYYYFLYVFFKKTTSTNLYAFLYASYFKYILNRININFPLASQIKLNLKVIWRLFLLIGSIIFAIHVVKAVILQIIR